MAQYSIFKFPINNLYKLFYYMYFRNNCPKLLNSCYVNVLGDVTPCCNLPNLKMENVKTNLIKNIYQNNKFKNFRKKYKLFCHGCTVLTR